MNVFQPPKKKRCFGYKEEPYYYLESSDSLWPEISSFYGFKEDKIDPTLFLTRTIEGKRRILYFTNSSVKDLVTLNQECIKVLSLILDLT